MSGFKELIGDVPWTPRPRFDGHTYDSRRDLERLERQLAKVRKHMSDGSWWLLRDLAARCGCDTPSVSARIRDLRKERFGGHTVERKSLGGGLFAYRLVEGRRV